MMVRASARPYHGTTTGEVSLCRSLFIPVPVLQPQQQPKLVNKNDTTCGQRDGQPCGLTSRAEAGRRGAEHVSKEPRS
jgi:hypothetical protein